MKQLLRKIRKFAEENVKDANSVLGLTDSELVNSIIATRYH